MRMVLHTNDASDTVRQQIVPQPKTLTLRAAPLCASADPRPSYQQKTATPTSRAGRRVCFRRVAHFPPSLLFNTLFDKASRAMPLRYSTDSDSATAIPPLTPLMLPVFRFWSSCIHHTGRAMRSSASRSLEFSRSISSKIPKGSHSRPWALNLSVLGVIRKYVEPVSRANASRRSLLR